MSQLSCRKTEKIHSRNMEVCTYACDDPQSVIVEGVLKDHLWQPHYDLFGEKCRPGEFHHIVVRMRVESLFLVIAEIEGELITVPSRECDETLKHLQAFQGTAIAGGINRKIKEALGGKDGCQHMATLLQAMAPAAMHGYWSFLAQRPMSGDFSPELMKQFMINTCWYWREEGETAQRLIHMVGK